MVLLLLLFFSSGAVWGASGAPKITPQVRSHFIAAEKARVKGDYALAEHEYRKVITLSPHFAEAYMNLGLIYQLQHQVPEAMQMFEQALKYRPELVGANFFLGMDYCQRGQCKQAIPLLRTAVHSRPDQAAIWTRLATAEEMVGDLPAEVHTLRHGLGLHPNSADMLYLLGHAYTSMGRRTIDRLRKLHGDSSYLEQLLARDYMNSNFLTAAFVHMQNALAISPKRPALHLELADLYLRAGRLKLAGDEIQKALALDPHSLGALVRRGEVRLFENDINGALADWSTATKIDLQRTESILGIRAETIAGMDLEPLSPSLVKKIPGLQADLRGRSGEGARLAEAFLEVHSGGEISSGSLSLVSEQAGHRNPPVACDTENVRRWLEADELELAARCEKKVVASGSRPGLRLQLARARFLTGKPFDALEILNGLPASTRNSSAALYWRVRAYNRLALTSYQKLYEVAPNSYRVYELKGDTYEARGEDLKAVKEYRKALSEKPNLPNLHYEIGHLLWKHFKVKAARKELRAELALNPRHAGALIDMGTTYLYEHQPTKALPYLRKAEAIVPHETDVDRFLGMAYLQIGKYSQAWAELEKVGGRDKTGNIHYLLAKVAQAMGKHQEAMREFSISSKLNQQSRIKNDKRVQRLAQASEILN